jgi:hypothetical protein
LRPQSVLRRTSLPNWNGIFEMFRFDVPEWLVVQRCNPVDRAGAVTRISDWRCGRYDESRRNTGVDVIVSHSVGPLLESVWLCLGRA